MTTSIDLCRLRPGDVIFTLAPAKSSFAIALFTARAYSHAMIVLYPDVWFETDGISSGFKPIKDVRAYTQPDGGRSIVADLPYVKLEVVRLPVAPSPDQILSSVARHISWQYPEAYEFLPLLVGLSMFPRFAEWLVRRLGSRRAYETGSYCSQLVFKILDETVGLVTYRYNGHISPGRLRKSLIKRDNVAVIDVSPGAPTPPESRDAALEHRYGNLSIVVDKLVSYQYPHDKASREAALKRTFAETGLPFDPAHFIADPAAFRTVITTPRFFRLHEIFWPRRYR